MPRARLLGGIGYALGTALILQPGCATEPSNPDRSVQTLTTEASHITAFVQRLHLQRPLLPARADQSEVRSFDRTGKLVSRRVLTRVEEHEMAHMVRALLRNATGSMPSAGSTTPPVGGPSAAAPTDTTVTFEIESTTYEMEAVSVSGLTVLAITDPGDTPMVAGWVSFVVSGDTTAFTGIVSQAYHDGYLAEEVYASASAIEDLNEDIFETAPPMATPGCDFARTALRWATLGTAISWIKVVITKSFADGFSAVATTVGWFGAVQYYACECTQYCVQTAPPNVGFTEGAMYRHPSSDWVNAMWPRTGVACTLSPSAAV